MSEFLKIAGATAVALMLVAALVLVGHDTTTFVSPPEAVAEDFVRRLVTGRYDRAAALLESPSADAEAGIERMAHAIAERGGAVNQVEGERGTIGGETANADARVTTERGGDVTIAVRMIRRYGEWRVKDWSLRGERGP